MVKSMKQDHNHMINLLFYFQITGNGDQKSDLLPTP